MTVELLSATFFPSTQNIGIGRMFTFKIVFEARSGDPKVAPYQPTSCHAIERLSNHHGGGLG